MLSLSKQIVLLNRLRQAQAATNFFKLIHYPIVRPFADIPGFVCKQQFFCALCSI